MKKVFFCSIYALLPVLASTSFSFPQETKEMLKRHMDALGGEENIMNIETLFGRGKINMAGIEGQVKVWWSGTDKVRQEFYFPLFGPPIVTDGESFWTEEQSGGAGRLGEGKWMQLLDQFFLENYAYLLTETRNEIRKAATRTIEDKGGQWVLDVISRDGKSRRLFIDDSSYLIERYHVTTNQESVTVRLSDYRNVGGVVFPFRMHRTTGAPHSDTFVEFVEIVMNPPLSETLFVRPEAVGEDYRFASNTDRVKIPFELVSNHIYFKASINGSPPLSFLLDTGAQLSYLDFSKADELAIRKTDDTEPRRVGGCDDLIFFKPDSMKLGSINLSPDGSSAAQYDDLTLFDQTVAGISLGQVEKFDGQELDGILGCDFLRRFVVEIDYINEVLSFYEPENFEYTGDGEIVKIKFEWYIPTIKALVDGEYEGVFRIDTGSRNNLDLFSGFVKTHKFLEKYPNYLETLVGFGITGPTKGVVGRIKSFQLGSFFIDSPVTGSYLEHRKSLGSARNAGRIGGGILKRFKVIFDFPRCRMILEKNANYYLRDRYNTSGIQLIQEDEKTLVYYVIENSPAGRARIKKGDELLLIDDVPVSSLSLQRIRELLNQEEGTRIELELKRKTETKRVNLTLREMT